MADYVLEFQRVSLECPHLSEEEKVELFIVSLTPPLSTLVRMFRPKTLDEVKQF